MKRKILFIIPNLATGGTNSSLDSFYLKLKYKYDINVFAISHQPREHDYSFDEVLLPQDVVLSLIFSNFSGQSRIGKIKAVGFKLLSLLLRKLGVELEMIQGKRVVKKLEKTTCYDCVVGFQEGFATKLCSFFTNPNKVGWIHCNYDMYLQQDKSEEDIYERFKKIVCVSQYTSSVFSTRYPTLTNRTVAIHNLLDTEKIIQLGEAKIDDDRFSTSDFVILSVGRFSTVKRFREIPAIAFCLKNRGLRFVWYIIGPSDGTKEGFIFESNLDHYGVQDYVKWLGGKKNPYPYFKSANLYVCLSQSEACPMVFKEARLFGLPIVTTNFPSSFEFVHEGEGLIVPFEQLCDAIIKMSHHIQEGRDSIFEKSNENIILAQIEDVLN